MCVYAPLQVRPNLFIFFQIRFYTQFNRSKNIEILQYGVNVNEMYLCDSWVIFTNTRSCIVRDSTVYCSGDKKLYIKYSV